MTNPDASELLAMVERSPLAAKSHDRSGWLELFADDGLVNDPVGSAPHRGPPALGAFYDTFIGPRDITFHSEVDIVCGQSVFRDVTLEVRMSDSVTLWVPAHVRYDLIDDAGSLRIARLLAYWELPAMIGQLLRAGAGALPVSVRLSRALLGNQRLGGTLGFLQGFRRVSGRAKRSAREFLTAAAFGDVQAAAAVVPRAGLFRNDSPVATAGDLVTGLEGVHAEKFLAAGHCVAVRLSHSYWRGVAYFDFGSHGVQAIRVYSQSRD